MRTSGRVVGQVLVELEKKIKPGVTTLELDKFAYEFFKKNDCVPAFLGYHGYPATICASVNDEVVHGIPGKRVLEEGDIVGIDVGAFYKGYCRRLLRASIGALSNAGWGTGFRTSATRYRNMLKPGAIRWSKIT